MVLIILPVPALIALTVPLVAELPMIKGVVVPPLWRIVIFPLPAPTRPALQILLAIVQEPKEVPPFKRTRFPVVGSVPASIVTLPLVLPTPEPYENTKPEDVMPPPAEVRLTLPPLTELDKENILSNVMRPPVEVKLIASPLPELELDRTNPVAVMPPPVEVRLTAPPLPELESENIPLDVVIPHL